MIQHWMICAVQIEGTVTLCCASHPVRMFTGWRDDGKPIFDFLHHYHVEIAKAKCFDPSEVATEVQLLQLIAGGKYHVFAVPRPMVCIGS